MELNELFGTKEKSFELQGHTFKFKEVTIEDEAENYHLYQDEVVKNGKTMNKYNPAKYEVFRLCLFTETPFGMEFINKYVKYNKGWDELTIKERFKFMNMLSSDGITQLKSKYYTCVTEVQDNEVVGK